jgi:uncharacterized coiled-coil protein SlyX
MAVSEARAPYGNTELEARVRRLEQQQDIQSAALSGLIYKVDALQESTDRQFAAVNKRIDDMDKRFDTRLSNIERMLALVVEAVTKGSPPQNNA